MPTGRQKAAHRRWLETLTGIPTAAGREGRVIKWVESWAARRDLPVHRDAAGNLVVGRAEAGRRDPVWFTAHLDHPAFVVRGVSGDREVELEFRGSVHDPYFHEARIEILDRDDRAHRAVVTRFDPGARPFKRVTALLRRPAELEAGDIGRWAWTGRGRTPAVAGGRLYAPACDDLAGVAGALAALDVLRAGGGAHAGVLLTRAEEVGFIGAVAACKNGTVPARARLICLENSRSFPESPIGAGPILRVGDRLSVFSPRLTNRLAALLRRYQQRNPDFKAQRKLMAGGTCEASTFSAYGHESTCVCLPLGNYHNMIDIDGVLAGRRPARVGPEYIALDDFHGMVELLVWFARELDSGVPEISARMDERYRGLKKIVLE